MVVMEIQALMVEIATGREVAVVVAEETMEIVVLVVEVGEVVSSREEATEATAIMVMMATGDSKTLTMIITIISGEVARAQPNTLVHVVAEVGCLPRVAATTLLQTPKTLRSSKSSIIRTSRIRASSTMYTECGPLMMYASSNRGVIK